MIKPNIPNIPNIPGMGAMTDTLDFVKNLWGSMGLPGMNMSSMSGINVPGMVMPTLSVDEINKKISDLKAVESWLSLNMGMLRSTIQALEVQAATISTLQTMGERFTATINPGGQEASAASHGSKAGNGSSNGASDNLGAERVHAAPPEPTSKDVQDAASLTAPLVNAAAWWNMLQDQFKQAVNTAMTETQAVAAAATAPASERPKAKAASKPKAAATPASSSSASSSGTTRKRKTSK